MDRTHQSQPQHSPEVAAYAHAAQNCRDIAAEVGLRNCDNDLDWLAAELVANTRFDEALNAGHSYDEVLKAGRKA